VSYAKGRIFDKSAKGEATRDQYRPFPRTWNESAGGGMFVLSTRAEKVKTQQQEEKEDEDEDKKGL
jgi:hypothetical protein